MKSTEKYVRQNLEQIERDLENTPDSVLWLVHYFAMRPHPATMFNVCSQLNRKAAQVLNDRKEWGLCGIQRTLSECSEYFARLADSEDVKRTGERVLDYIRKARNV